MSSRPSPLPHTFLSPITVPVVPHPCFQLIPWIPVPPTARPSCSMTQYSSLGSRAILSSHSFSYSRLGGLRNTRKCVTSKSSNQVIITGASSGRGGRRRSSLPWMTGPYMARKVKRLARGVELRGFLDVDRDRGPLGGGEIERAQVLTLRGRRLVSDQRVHQRREVLVQLTRVERHLADGSVDDAELVGPELDLAALHLAHGACHVVGDRARFRVGHQAPRSEDLSKRAYARHQVAPREPCRRPRRRPPEPSCQCRWAGRPTRGPSARRAADRRPAGCGLQQSHRTWRSTCPWRALRPVPW